MDLLKKKFQIVIARYNEDIKWLLPYKDITIIYNKGNYDYLLHKFNVIYLNNVGRESHTYLYHIINNYDNLTDKTIFFQGNISDHSKKILEIEDYFQDDDFIGFFDNYNIDKLKENINHFSKYTKDLRKSNFNTFNWITKVLGIRIDDNLKETNVVWNANFSVSKEMILSKPKIFYENILRHINNHSNPEEGHFLERSWYLIFHSNFDKKDIIEYKKLIDTQSIEYLYNICKNKSNQVHLWIPVSVNNDIGIHKKIHFMKSINTYITLNTKIIDNKFNIGIQSSNDISILVNYQYEILLGVFNNTKSIIKDLVNNKIIHSYEHQTLDKDKLLNFHFSFNHNIIIKRENSRENDIMNSTIFNFKDIFDIDKITSIKIKNNGHCNTTLSYEHINNLYNENNVKVHLINNYYEDIDEFYRNNYLDYYIKPLNI
jgi:hypothetical protein